jgi:hypothetical protein
MGLQSGIRFPVLCLWFQLAGCVPPQSRLVGLVFQSIAATFGFNKDKRTK